ncbi:hypothetical protein BZA77DRAFT_298371 [Pyronema omphalodes]|nr:hypothetical protein BZA77DRAFT_298371 [Pyronema omphalodes]
MLPNLCKIYQNIYNTFFPLSPEPTKITRHSHLWLIKYLHADLTITDRTVITGNIEKANFASLIYFEEKYHGSEKPFYLTVAEVDIYIAPLDVKQNSLAVPLGIPSAAPLEAPPAPPLDSNPPSASEKTIHHYIPTLGRPQHHNSSLGRTLRTKNRSKKRTVSKRRMLLG